MQRRPPRGMFDRLTARLRLNWYRAIRGDEGSRYLAGGLALGIFVSVYPLSVLQLPLAWGLAWLFRVSQVSAAAGVMISNPLTIAPIFVFTTTVGLMVTPGGENSAMMQPLALIENPEVRASLGAHDITIIVVGATLVGLIAAALTYWLGLRWIAAWRVRRLAYRKISTKGLGESGLG